MTNITTPKDPSSHSNPSDAEKAAAGVVSRRGFLTAVGGVGVGALLAGAGASVFLVEDDVYAVEASGGYLLVDTKKCGACETCMISCTLAHAGRANINLARIQLTKNPLGNFPVDVAQNQCRQCPFPSCVEACPTGAMHVDEATGVRMVDEGKCIGCERCIEGCPFTPSRVQWNFEDKCAQKCDLCLNTPGWDQEGGPDGHQACIEVCPMKAIALTREIPQQGDEGYLVNLRNEHWAIAGFPIDDDAKELPNVSVPREAALSKRTAAIAAKAE